MTEQATKKPRAPRKKKEVVAEQSSDNVKISVEQILAAIVEHFGKIEIPVDTLVKSFDGKQIAVTQDGPMAVFEIVDEVASA